MREYQTWYTVTLHNSSSLESQILMVTGNQGLAEDLFSDISRVLSPPMGVSIDIENVKNHSEGDIF